MADDPLATPTEPGFLQQLPRNPLAIQTGGGTGTGAVQPQAGPSVAPWRAAKDMIAQQQFGASFDALPPQSAQRDRVVTLYKLSVLNSIPADQRSQATVLDRVEQMIEETIRQPEVFGVGQVPSAVSPGTGGPQSDQPVSSAPGVTATPVAEERGLISNVVGSIVGTIMSGIAGLETGVAGLVKTGADYAGIDTQDSFLDDFIRRGTELQANARTLLPQSAQDALNNVSAAAEQGVIPAIEAAMNNPSAIAVMIGESLSSLSGAGKLVQAANVASGTVTRGVLSRVGVTNTGQLSQKGTLNATIATLVASEAGSAANEARNVVSNLKLDDLRQDADFRELEQQVGEDEARKIYAQRSAQFAALLTAGTGAISFLPGFNVLESVLTKTPVTTTLSRVSQGVRTGLAESGEEFVQESVQSAAVGSADPTKSAQDLTQAALGSGALGALTGGPVGLVTGSIAGQARQGGDLTTPGTATNEAPPPIDLTSDFDIIPPAQEPEPVTVDTLAATTVQHDAKRKAEDIFKRKQNIAEAQTTPGTTTAVEGSTLTDDVLAGKRTNTGGTPIQEGTLDLPEAEEVAPAEASNPDLTTDQRSLLDSLSTPESVADVLKVNLSMSAANSGNISQTVANASKRGGQSVIDSLNREIGRLESNGTAIGRQDANKLKGLRDLTANVFDSEPNIEEVTTAVQAISQSRYAADKLRSSQAVRTHFKDVNDTKAVLTAAGMNENTADKMAPIIYDAAQTGNGRQLMDTLVAARDGMYSQTNQRALRALISDAETQLGIPLNPQQDVQTGNILAAAPTQQNQAELDKTAKQTYTKVRQAMADPIDGLTSLLQAAGIPNPAQVAQTIADKAVGSRNLTRTNANNISFVLKKAADIGGFNKDVAKQLRDLATLVRSMNRVDKKGGAGKEARGVVQRNMDKIVAITDVFDKRGPPLASTGTAENFKQGATTDVAPVDTDTDRLFEESQATNPESFEQGVEPPFYSIGSGAIWERNTWTKWDELRKKFFDNSWAITRRFQNRPDIPEGANVMLQLGLMVGKMSQINERDLHSTWAPLYQRLYQTAYRDGVLQRGRINQGLIWKQYLSDVSDGLKALHAPERNKLFFQMKSRYDADTGVKKARILKDLKAGNIDPISAREQWDALLDDAVPIAPADMTQAGMSDQQAAEVIARLEQSGIMTVVRELRPYINNVVNAATVNNLDSGRYGQEAQRIREFYGFDNYVPLKGGMRQDDVFAEAFLGGTPNAALTHTETLTEGRITDADNVLLHLRADMLRSGRRIAEADVLASLKNAVQHNILKGTVQPVDVLEATQQGFKSAFDVPTNLRDKVFIYRDGDNAYSIELEDDQIIISLKQLYSFRVLDNVMLKPLAKVTSFSSRAITSYNPAFWLKSFIYDATGNIINLTANFGTGPALRYTAAVLNPVTMVGAMRYHFSDMDTKQQLAQREGTYAWYANKYTELGGNLGFVHSLGLEEGTRDKEGNKRVKGRDFLKLPLTEVVFGERSMMYNTTGSKEHASKFVKFLDRGASAFEMSARIPAFRILLDTGKYTDKEAAFHTKKLMDFSQSGEWGSMIAAWMMFARPALTGTDRIIDAVAPINPNTGQRKFNTEFVVLSMGAMLGLVAMQNMGLGDDEEEMSASRKDHKLDTLMSNIIIGTDDKEGAIKIPLAPGLPRLFKGIAEAAWAWSTEERDASEIIGALTKVASQSTLPVPMVGADPIKDLPDFLFQAIAPSAIRPVVDIGLNESAFGGTIASPFAENRDEYKAKQGRAGTPEFYKDIATYFARVTDGGIDVPPEHLQYMANGYLGGWATELGKVAKLMEKVRDGREVELPEDVPIMSGFYTRDAEFRWTNEYFRIDQDVNDMKKVSEDARSTFNLPDYVQNMEVKIRFWNEVQQDVKDLIKQRSEIASNPVIGKTEANRATSIYGEKIKTARTLAVKKYTEVFEQ